MTVPAPDSQTSAPAQNRRRFRSHLVNMDVRLRLVVDDVIFALIAALAAIGILYFFSNREIGDSMYSAHISIKQTRELLNGGVKIAGVVTFFSVLVFGFWSVIDAHRIAGPMHRLLRLLNEVAAGDLTHEIKFRKRDEFQEIAAAADNVVDVYAERLGAICQQIRDASVGLSGDTLSPAQIQIVRKQLERAESGLAFFRVPEGRAPEIDNSPIQ